MEIVEARRGSMIVSLDDMRRTPLDRIPVDQATDIVRQLMRHQESALERVEVARFGSSV